LQAATTDCAIFRADAPEGFSQIIFGAGSGADNVILQKQHLDNGDELMLSRNQTQALGIDVAGSPTQTL